MKREREQAMQTTYINFHAGINPNTAQNLMTAISQRLNAGTTHFYILLSTPGGAVQSGMTVYNFLRGIPAPRSRCTTLETLIQSGTLYF
jgi:ATP-dependent protease ClpP protease subunit